MKTKFVRLLIVGIVGGSVLNFGDVLELKNGKRLEGKFSGGTGDAINFDSGSGPQAIAIGEIVGLSFSDRTPAASGTAAAKSTGTASSTTIPTGTTLLVRVIDPVSSQSPAGTRFATRLEYDLMAGNNPVLKAGTTVYGKVASSTQARRAVGKSTLDVRLIEISAGGQPVPITTSGFKEASEASIRKAGRGAAAGATIGAIAGDAGKGAAIGATVGALKKGETITIPQGALLEFTLSQPVTINGK